MIIPEEIAILITQLFGEDEVTPNPSDFLNEDSDWDDDIDDDSITDNDEVDDDNNDDVGNPDKMGDENEPTARVDNVHDGVTFKSIEDMLPYAHLYDEENLNSLYDDPFGVYAIQHHPVSALAATDYIVKPDFGETITEDELQALSDTICDALHLKHIPVIFTEDTANAAYTPGLFPKRSFDDAILINPHYAQECINKIGSSDIVISDLAHEIGHYFTQMKIGRQKTYLSEKLADFISGFIDKKLGVDIEVAREWFKQYYDPKGVNGYPVSEERWDIQAAGGYYGAHASFDDVSNSFDDKHFIELVKQFKSDNRTDLAEMERLRINQHGSTESKAILFSFNLDPNKKRILMRKLLEVLKKRV